MCRLRYVLFVILAVIGSTWSPLKAELVLNGSFETPNLGIPNRVSISSLSAWTASGGFMLLERGINADSNIAAFDGQQFVSMGHSGASNDRLFQSVTTVIGQTYHLTFNIASIQGTAFQTVRASAFNASDAEIAFSESNVTTANLWKGSVPLQFTANSLSTRIEFRHTVANSSANVAIDNVHLNEAVAVPEPSSAILLMLGTMALAMNRYRHEFKRLHLRLVAFQT